MDEDIDDITEHEFVATFRVVEEGRRTSVRVVPVHRGTPVLVKDYISTMEGVIPLQSINGMSLDDLYPPSKRKGSFSVVSGDGEKEIYYHGEVD